MFQKLTAEGRGRWLCLFTEDSKSWTRVRSAGLDSFLKLSVCNDFRTCK